MHAANGGRAHPGPADISSTRGSEIICGSLIRRHGMGFVRKWSSEFAMCSSLRRVRLERIN